MLHGVDLFSGIGGVAISLRGLVLPVAYCEIEPFCQTVLLQRMQAGDLPAAPIWDDVRTVPREFWANVDIITGGFPCQDISVAGCGKGLEGKRSGLFFSLLKWVDVFKPPFIFLENVPGIRTKGAERVCKQMAKRGYDCAWTTNTAKEFGAPHKRERWWLLAISSHATSKRLSEGASKEILGEFKDSEQQIFSDLRSEAPKNPWKAKPPVCGVDDGGDNRLDRIKALGNSVVPEQCRMAFKILMGMGRLDEISIGVKECADDN